MADRGKRPPLAKRWRMGRAGKWSVPANEEMSQREDEADSRARQGSDLSSPQQASLERHSFTQQ